MNARRNYTELKAQRAEVTGKENLAMKEAGKFFIDISKLVIGGVILTSVMKQDLNILPTLLLGLSAVCAFFILGILLLIKSNKKGDK